MTDKKDEDAKGAKGAMSGDLFEHEMVTNAKVLGRETGINVVIGGDRAETDGKTVTLPSVGNANVSRKAANVARGFVNHEAAGLRYTNPHTRQRMGASPNHSTFFKAMDSVRVERRFSETYEGSVGQFEATTDAMIKRIAKTIKSGEVPASKKADVVPALASMEGRKLTGQHVDKGALEEVRNFVGKDLADVAMRVGEAASKAKSTLDISRWLEKWLGDVAPETEQERREERRRMAGEGGSGLGEGDGEGEGEGEGDDGEGDGPMGSAPSIGSDKGSWKPPLKAPNLFRTVMSDVVGEGLPVGTSGYQSDKRDDRVWEDFERYILNANLVSRRNYEVGRSSPDYRKTYVPKTKRDIVRAGLMNIEEMRRELGLPTRKMKGALERGLITAQRRAWLRGQQEGVIDPKRLASVITGQNNYRRVRAETMRVEAAVQLVIDMSGSMSGEKAVEAMRAAFVFADSLSKVNVPIEVVGFYSDRDRHSGAGWSHRDGNIDMPVFKQFTDPLRTSLWKLGLVSPTIHCRQGGNNADGDSLLMAWRRLRKRPEKRKVMIVFSDGHPSTSGCGDEYGHLRNVVHNITAQGCEPFGVGIIDSAVRGFYPDHIVIRNAEELPAKAGAFLHQLLMPAKDKQKRSIKAMGGRARAMKAA